jgi:hypothetical protein
LNASIKKNDLRIFTDKKEDKKEENKETPERGRNQNPSFDQNDPEIEHDYEQWEMKNKNSITKIIVTTFPKFFLFFAFAVGF